MYEGSIAISICSKCNVFVMTLLANGSGHSFLAWKPRNFMGSPVCVGLLNFNGHPTFFRGSGGPCGYPTWRPPCLSE